LQRAFHLRGCGDVVADHCRDVVADERTAALLALFCHHVWGEGQRPPDALRAARLTLRRHPRAAFVRIGGPE
jgi:hypothetical protein